ncbi:MAG TPA: hypothetical protein VM388_06240 [Acidimicrobiales bacterium]|nr:hypothetical protein [Acidimicrobiales bacterium]HWI04634.1 hypothetical protein [Acidimicrobiales bacterium]
MSDPLERLRALNPVPAAEVALSTPDPALFDRITSLPRVPADPLRRRRRGRRLVPALVVTSLLGGAAAFGLLRGDVSRPETVLCFQGPDLTADADAVGVQADGSIETCAGLWRRGVFGEVSEVPPLVECVLPSGVAGVFPAAPGTDVCTALNLVPVGPPLPASTTTAPSAPAPPPPADVNARILGFRDAVLAQFLDTPCMAPAAGVDIVRRELDRAGLGDWTVVSGAFSADRPCATLSLHSPERQVILVPSTPRR